MKFIFVMATLFGLLIALPEDAKAQFLTPVAVYDKSTKTVSVTFNDVIEKVNNTGIPNSQRTAVDCADIIYKKSGQAMLLFCDAFSEGKRIVLSNFRSALAPTSALINIEDNNKYSIQWDSVKDSDHKKALSAITKLELDKNSPRLNASLIEENFNQIEVTPRGFDPDDIVKVFGQKPNLIKVLYSFPASDPARSFETDVIEINRINSTKTLLFTLKDSFPIRPDKYSLIVKIPWKELLSSGIQPIDGFSLPELEEPSKDSLTGATTVNRLPNKPERGKSEYAFEAGFTSTVNTTNRKRNNVGIFGLTVKPFIGLKSFGIGRGDSGNNEWLALRPLLIADVDTQKVSQSKSPNRVQLGTDLEWGNNFGLDFDERGISANKKFLRQLIWTNGLRYDSDRDFKLQTMYWHTELAFGFRKFEQTFDQTLFRFRLKQESGDARKEPPVSSYFVRPSFGYELGGTIRRDARAINSPTKNISRAFIHLGMGLELKRFAKFSIDDTYYYLQNASRLKNRNYLEAVFELNTGKLSGIDLNGFSNAIFLKFQRGDQPPTFGSVNAFSLGFKIYK